MPKKLHRCVKKVEKKGGAVDPWAVCQAAINKAKKKSYSAK